MAKSYYKVINGKNYDRDMLEIAEQATPRKRGKPLIELELAQKLFQALVDGNEYTDVEKKTMKYIRDNYQFAKDADSYVRTEVRKFAAKQAQLTRANSQASEDSISSSDSDSDEQEIGEDSSYEDNRDDESHRFNDDDRDDERVRGIENSQDSHQDENWKNESSDSLDRNDSDDNSYSEHPDEKDDKSGFGELVAYNNQAELSASERRKKYMIRAALVAIFLLIILGITWSVCKPKSDGSEQEVTGFQTIEPNTTLDSDTSEDVDGDNEEDPSKESGWLSSDENEKSSPEENSSLDNDNILSNREEPVSDEKNESPTNDDIVEKKESDQKTNLNPNDPDDQGPGDEEFKNEPGIASPVRKLSVDKSDIKSSIRFVNSLEVPFIRNQGDITSEGKTALNDLADILKTHNNLIVRIEGHTCWIGSLGDNQTLSEKRAKVVYDYLISQGAPSENLEYRGYGELSSVASNRTKEGRLRNRRVEFSVLRLEK